MIKIKTVKFIEYIGGKFVVVKEKRIPRIGYNNTNTAIIRESISIMAKSGKPNYMNLYDKNGGYIVSWVARESLHTGLTREAKWYRLGEQQARNLIASDSMKLGKNGALKKKVNFH